MQYIYGRIMMKQIILDQYRSKIENFDNFEKLIQPKEGWIRTFRKALGMSGPQMAARMGISKSQASQMERMEVEDRITLKQLRKVADNLECDLHYAIVPRKPIKTMIREQAQKKAIQLVHKTHVQMKLEAQQLSEEKLQQQVNLEVERLLIEMPRNLWED